jgi:hypothetical protein
MGASPTVAGFRTAFRQPSITCAEVAWRWTVGGTAAALFLFLSIEYLRSLPVTLADSALLSTRQPALVGRAVSHILQGSLTRSALAVAVTLLAVAILWIFFAAIGRLLTVRNLLDACTGGATGEYTHAPPSLRAVLELNFLRVAIVLATITALAGSAILAGLVSSEAHPRPGLAILLFFALGIVALLAGWSLNWWLSLAAIFAIRDGQDALGAISAAVTFFREHSGSILAVSLWTGFAHLIAFSIATTAASLPFVLVSIAPRVVLGVVGVATLAYFAVVDWLYIARLAGYIHISEGNAAPPPLPTSPVATTIDRDELILSDLSNLALEG